MKNTIKRCVASVVFLAIFGWLFVHISYALRGEMSQTRNNLSGYYDLEENSLDAVFVGTSGTFTAFSPMAAWEKYGFASYVFSTNYVGENILAYMVHEAMKTQSPKVVVIDIFPFIRGQRIDNQEEIRVQCMVNGYKYSADRLKLIWDTFPEELDKTSYVFDLIKYHTNVFTWKNFFGAYHNVNKGFNFFEWVASKPPVMTDAREALGGYMNRRLKNC